MSTDIRSLVGVFDADGTLRGEVTYVVMHLVGRAECALCDITHGRVRRKRDFDAMRKRIGLPFDLVHRDELDTALRPLVTDRLPCVIARGDRGDRILLGPEELRSCRGEVDSLERVLREAIDAPSPGTA